MKKLLPVAYPPVTAYAHHTTVLSILALDESYLPWFCGNYIQLCFTKDPEFETDLDFFVPHKFTNHLPLCPLLETMNINKDILELCSRDIVAFVRQIIDSGYYIYIVVNCNGLPPYSEYMQERHHPIFLYGYDADEEVLYGADFFQRGVYRSAEISFAGFERAFNSTIQGKFWWNGMKLLRRKEGAAYEVDLIHVHDVLTDYLFSRDTSKHYRSIYNQFDNPVTGRCLFGLDAVYHRLISDFEKLRQCEDTWYDPRVLPVFTDHKKALYLIADYLFTAGFMKSGLILEELSDIHQRSLIVRNLFLKYRAKIKQSILGEIELRLADLLETERKTISRWIDDLQI